MAVDRRTTRVRAWAARLALLCALAAPAANAQLLSKELPEQVRGLEVVDRRGQPTPPDAVLVNHDGKAVPFGSYFNADGRPIILVLQYYRCPIVCPVVQQKLVECLNQLDYTAGKDFQIVVVSFDPGERTPVAASARQHTLEWYEREKTPEVRAGWAFHTGEEQHVRRLADAVGYDYRALPNGEYSHPVAFFVLTPDGRVSSAVYGFEYPPREVRLALLDASGGRIAQSIGDYFLHFCYRYDPTAGTFTLAAFRVMQLGGVLAMIGVFGLVAALLVRERVLRRRRGVGPCETATTTPAPARGALAGQTT
ncbi:MAG TPA: SCO family protein [Phycisphaerales bacterium]|nr:SCO family protein [Phycisphaerales bacterium]